MKFDLNCDLGENEPTRFTAALMRSVTSVNIACGGHAGDFQTMRAAVRLAVKNKVHIGAHPGLFDRSNFGRREMRISIADFQTLLIQQIGALDVIARNENAQIHHVKLHGALYHLVEDRPPLRRAYFEIVREFWPDAFIYSFAGGPVSEDASATGLKSWGEGFLDRAYTDPTRLVPRGEPGSVLKLDEFTDRLKDLLKNSTVKSYVLEEPLRVPAKTWCIHSDTREALEFAKRARAAFESANLS